MASMYYIGLDVHKKTISYCVKDAGGHVQAEGAIPATRSDLDRWMTALPQPWTAAMEATVFTGWIYDHLKPHAAALKVAHPLMLRAIAAAKKKNDRIDASKIADCLRCDFCPRVTWPRPPIITPSQTQIARRPYCRCHRCYWKCGRPGRTRTSDLFRVKEAL
jgi:transposase